MPVCFPGPNYRTRVNVKLVSVVSQRDGGQREMAGCLYVGGVIIKRAAGVGASRS